MQENGIALQAALRDLRPFRGARPDVEPSSGLAALRQMLGPTLPSNFRQELTALQNEADPELTAASLLHFAGRLERRALEAEALEIYAHLESGSDTPEPCRARARERRAALSGRGAVIGARAELLLRRFTREVTHPSALFAMGAAGAVFRLGRLAAMARLSQAPATWLSRGPGASLLASSGAFLLEAPAFTLAHRAADEALGHRLDWSRSALGRELASSFLVLGALRTAGTAPALLGAARGRTGVARLAQGLALYGGILLGHGLEIMAGLRPTQNTGELLMDSAALWLQFQAAGRLSRAAFGEGFARWEQRLDHQSRLFSTSLRPSPSIPLETPGFQAAMAQTGSVIPGVFTMSSVSGGKGGLRLIPSRGTGASQPPSLPPERVRPLPRGGVLAKTSAGWLQFGVPMWTNKDAFEIFLREGGFRLSREQVREILPTTYFFDLDYVSRHDGLLPADFMQYMYFVNRGVECTLVAPDAATARRLREFLDLSYQGPRSEELSAQVRAEYPAGAIGLPRMGKEISRGFPAEAPETLRSIAHLNRAGEYMNGEVRVVKRAALRYEIFESGVSQGVLDLGAFPVPESKPEPLRGPALSRARRKVLREGRPALWPIGTGHGFTPREETSGFLLWNGGKAVAIDPPSSTLDFLAKHRLPVESLDGILLTHGHTDHYGNAVPRLLAARPELKIYTTPTIFRMLQRQYALAVGENAEAPPWNFVPLYPQTFTPLIGLPLRPEYSFHPVPALGFEIFDRPDSRQGKLVVSFTGDTFADHVDLWRHTQAPEGQEPLMSAARAGQVLRHGALLLASKGQRPPPVFLIEGGVPPIHINPLRTRELLDQAEALGVDTSRVRLYHVAAEKAAEARVTKWPAGVEGFFDLSGYFR